MRSLTIGVPAMYADHHVVEVRRLLFAIPGVEEVNASAAFQVVEVGFDPALASEEALRQVLGEAGYLEELPVPAESGLPAVGRDGATYWRNAASVEPAGPVVAFGQQIPFAGRPLWPCPGMERGRTNEGASTNGG